MATSSEIAVREISGITKILQYEMHNEMSVHPTAKLICEVNQTFRLEQLADVDRQIHIERMDTGENIFTGYVEDASLEERQPGYFVLELMLIGTSIVLDKENRYCSYQQVSQTHQKLIENILSKQADDVGCRCVFAEDRAIGKPLIQYEETDWSFMKRVASRIKEPVFTDETVLSPYLYLGSSSGCGTGREMDARCISEGMDARFHRLGELAQEYGRLGYYFYKLSGRENYYLGEKVVYNGSEFYICEKVAKLEQEELIYTYVLAKESFMKIPPMFNPKLTGMSVLGTIQKVSGETMELSLQLKDEQDSTSYYAYDWRPEVGNLMYCMPKVGTVVSLYFPSQDEQDAYAVNCVRKIKTQKEQLFDETTKSFLTEQGKLMALSTSALHLCAMNPQQEQNYAQLSMIDTMQGQQEPTIRDIVEDMGMMLASNENVKLDAECISMDATYIDFLAGGRIRVISGAKEQGEKATASIELAAAYFSMTSEEMIRFVLVGRVGDNTFCVIQDEPKKKANQGALIWNAVVGLAVTGIIVAACVFALPVLLTGAVTAGVITATTVSTVAMGAAVGAAATGAFAVVEQYQSDKARGEASTWTDALKNVGMKSVFGAIEGGFMAIAGAGSIVTEGTQLLCKQTLKNVGKNVIINQIGSAIGSSGNVLADAVTGDGVTREEAIDYYCEGFVNGLFSSTLDIAKGMPWKEIPFVDNASKWVDTHVTSKMKQKVTNLGIYQKWEEQITRLKKWAGCYGEYGDYGEVDARLGANIKRNESTLVRVQDVVNEIADDIEDAQERVSRSQSGLASFINNRAESGNNHYFNGQQEYFEQRVRNAQQELDTLINRQTVNNNRISALTQEIASDKSTRKKERWGTFAVCSVIKYMDDRVQDFVKQQEPIPTITEETKDIGQWMFQE